MMYKLTHFISPFYIRFITALVCVLTFTSFTGSNLAKAQHVYLPSNAFQHGEMIRYTVFYNVIGMYVNAGTAVLTTKKAKYNNLMAYHVVAEGTTNSKYDWIYKVRDRYESYFDAKDLKSLKFMRDINEGDFKHREEIVFNHKNNTASTEDKTYKIPAKTMDVINAMFYARNIDYNAYREGDKISFSMFLDNKVYNMYIRYLGKERIKTRYGTFNAIKLRPLLLKGSIFEGGENMSLWVSDDANHIPLRVESKIAVGSVKVDMMEYANIKHPLTSLISKR